MKPDALDQEIARVVNYLKDMHPDEEDYKAAVENLKTLTEARSKPSPRRVNLEVLAGVLGNLLMTLLVLNRERGDVVISKALNWIRPNR